MTKEEYPLVKDKFADYFAYAIKNQKDTRLYIAIIKGYIRATEDKSIHYFNLPILQVFNLLQQKHGITSFKDEALIITTIETIMEPILTSLEKNIEKNIPYNTYLVKSLSVLMINFLKMDESERDTDQREVFKLLKLLKIVADHPDSTEEDKDILVALHETIKRKIRERLIKKSRL